MDLKLQLHGLIALVRGELIALTIAMFAVVAFQCLMGKIRLHGLFVGPDGHFSATRLQLLMTTLAVALNYMHEPERLFSASPVALGLTVGGSNLLYLARKYQLLSA